MDWTSGGNTGDDFVKNHHKTTKQTIAIQPRCWITFDSSMRKTCG